VVPQRQVERAEVGPQPSGGVEVAEVRRQLGGRGGDRGGVGVVE
jgi:hypothetical protein